MSDENSLEEVRKKKREQLVEEEEGADAPSEPIHIDSQSELDEAVQQYDVVLVDFYADWCGPCKMLTPIVESLAAETDAAIAKVDVDANQSLARQYGVQGVPTLVLFADGQQVEQMVGVQQEEALAQTIAQYN
ncbi:thioredoxin [Salinibaculum rarum]|uniref:thioredoxin n=1 Tax=Salinibaculum rarum TaxID=3058903 RepID=UPI00265ED214|nr:thioredoxin [Salinibaculum sp. KK48]